MALLKIPFRIVAFAAIFFVMVASIAKAVALTRRWKASYTVFKALFRVALFFAWLFVHCAAALEWCHPALSDEEMLLKIEDSAKGVEFDAT